MLRESPRGDGPAVLGARLDCDAQPARLLGVVLQLRDFLVVFPGELLVAQRARDVARHVGVIVQRAHVHAGEHRSLEVERVRHLVVFRCARPEGALAIALLGIDEPIADDERDGAHCRAEAQTDIAPLVERQILVNLEAERRHGHLGVERHEVIHSS